MHPDNHIPITCNYYPKCKKEYKRKKTNILHALLQKKKKLTGFIPLIPSYPTKKNLVQKRKYVPVNHLHLVLLYRFPTLSLAKL